MKNIKNLLTNVFQAAKLFLTINIKSLTKNIAKSDIVITGGKAMNDQKRKLEAVKKKCRTASKVVRVVEIIVIILAVLAIVGAVCCFVMRDSINDWAPAAIEAGYLKVENLQIGRTFRVFIDYSQAYEAGSYAVPFMFNGIFAATVLFVVFIVLRCFRRIFDSLEKESTPFSDNILRQLKLAFIIIVIALLIYSGIGLALIAGLLFWCIYSIMDYGLALQTEVDETL